MILQASLLYLSLQHPHAISPFSPLSLSSPSPSTPSFNSLSLSLSLSLLHPKGRTNKCKFNKVMFGTVLWKNKYVFFYYFNVLIFIFSSYSVGFSIDTLSFQQRFIVKLKHKVNREIRKNIVFKAGFSMVIKWHDRHVEIFLETLQLVLRILFRRRRRVGFVFYFPTLSVRASRTQEVNEEAKLK